MVRYSYPALVLISLRMSDTKRYLYIAVGVLLVAISPYVVFYEGQTFFGVGFAVLGLVLIADELLRKDTE